jgi:hypothetical protein
MNRISAKVVASTIESGSVYVFVDNKFVNPTPHYFVVLNPNPLDSIVIVFVYATSKVEKRKNRAKRLSFPVDTIVEVTPKECSFLDHISVFDCNDPRIQSSEALFEKIQNGFFHHIGRVTNEVLEKLRNGVEKSTVVSAEIKKLIR